MIILRQDRGIIRGNYVNRQIRKRSSSLCAYVPYIPYSSYYTQPLARSIDWFVHWHGLNMMKASSTNSLRRLLSSPRNLSSTPYQTVRTSRTFSSLSCLRKFDLRLTPLSKANGYNRLQRLTWPPSRSISTKPLPSTRGPAFRFFYRSFAYTGAFIMISTSLVVAFFLYDASTYREDLSFTDIPVSLSALEPRRGGPKNLPIAEVLVDDDDCAEMQRQRDKPKLVILGSGWGSVAILKTLNADDYHVTVVSPCNHFLFTPMLPSATVGTLELRSLAEPMRRIVRRVRGHFLKAEAEEVEFSEKLLEVSQLDANGVRQHFYLPYDKLVIAVGKSFDDQYQITKLRSFRIYLKSTWRKGIGELPFSQVH